MELTVEELAVMELAFLFKMPLYKLLNEMPYEEFIAWTEFFKVRPVGQAEDYRAAMMMAALGTSANLMTVFPTLKPIEPIGNNLKNSVFYQKILGAVGGEKIPL